eukprot:CAMPEP_0170411842 /NCGR_PEP_ID=MMETSP0117_2-20130122/30637_1 /TAXON_ID=400756 /ORGANISM="Durinskia baltica, Strain CSIRO CS-38" /LENGTH=40 /DNA_ID= /DNA_START= /DNA_END= /DNA_ORIENTATION=
MHASPKALEQAASVSSQLAGRQSPVSLQARPLLKTRQHGE